jgi:hypothetical protein
LLVLWLVPLGLAAVLIGGCQGPGATATATKPAEPVRQETAAVSTPGAQEKPAPAAEEAQVKVAKPARGKVSGQQPQITVENDVCDLGEVAVDAKLAGQFKFTNTGTAPLRITQVVGCCGVALKGVEAGQEYAPGQSGTLEFEYRALSLPNPAVKKILYLQTNDPEQKITTLTVKMAIVRRVDFQPEVLSKLLLNAPNAGCPALTLTSSDGRPFSITGFEATANTMTAEFDPSVKATRFVLKPKVDLAKLEQNMRGRIGITLTHPECTYVEVLYDVLPEFEMSTSQIIMFNLRVGQAVQREFSIANNYQNDFEIESVSSHKGALKLVGQTKVGSGYRLRIEVTPPPHQRSEVVMSDMLEVKTKDGKTLSVPVRGFYEDR